MFLLIHSYFSFENFLRLIFYNKHFDWLKCFENCPILDSARSPKSNTRLDSKLDLGWTQL